VPELQAFPLVTTSGKSGQVFRASRFLDRSNTNQVRLDDGTELTVLTSALRVQPDGTFLLDEGEGATTPRPAQRAAAPAPERTAVEAEPEAPAGGSSLDRHPEFAETAPMTERESAPAPMREEPRYQKATPERDVVIDEPLFGEDVTVERVQVNRLVDAAPQSRQDGDTTIIPVVEEVITVQKRLLLREEVRITRRRTTIREPRRILVDGDQPRILGSDGREVDLEK